MVTIERRIAPQEKVGSDAFRIEYRVDTPDQVLYDDVVSYLGEYRFGLSKYCYNLKFSEGKLKDPNRNENMEELAQRAIDRKVKEGRSSIRERAEKIGFQSLDRQLVSSKIGDTIIWASPPGPKEDGYGDYGFVYFGKVQDYSLEEKNIKMTAIRVENPSIRQFNRLVRMFGNENIEYVTAEEFLSNPYVFVEDLKEGYLDAILKTVFGFKSNEKEQEEFRQIIKKMFPLISEFARNPWRSMQDLYALENYALKLKKEKALEIVDFRSPLRIGDLAVVYRDEPPKVAGSCGSTGNNNGLQSSNIFNSLSSLNSFLSEDKYGSQTFECPSCGKKNIRPKDKLISNCQHCGRDVTC